MSKDITCKRAVTLLLQKEEAKLSAVHRFRLWRHLSGCSLCDNFAHQSRLIQRIVAQHEPEQTLSAADKQQLIATVLGSAG